MCFLSMCSVLMCCFVLISCFVLIESLKWLMCGVFNNVWLFVFGVGVVMVLRFLFVLFMGVFCLVG